MSCSECCGRCRIDPRANARLTHLPIGKNPAQVIVREESNWVCNISAPGSIQRRRQQGGNAQECQAQKSPAFGRLAGELSDRGVVNASGSSGGQVHHANGTAFSFRVVLVRSARVNPCLNLREAAVLDNRR